MDEQLKDNVTRNILEGLQLHEVISEIDHGIIDEANNPYSNIPGFRQTVNFKPKYSQAEIDKKKKSKNTIAKFFSNMSRLGMTYDEKVIDNMRAIPADKNMLPKEQSLAQQEMFSMLSNNWKVKDNRDKNFFEKDFALKRETLRNIAVQPEIEDILDTMCNECIVYDAKYTYCMEPFIDAQDLDELEKSKRDEISNSMNRSFKRFYKMLEWRTRAWDDFKRFLVEGILAWEIVYDSLEKPTQIIGLIPLDPATLTKVFNNNKWYWIQFKGVNGKERKLLDNQIVYIQYQETNSIKRLSYLERLIRPFNIYRIIEQAQIIWTVTNAQYKMMFTIPIKNMSRAMGSQTLMSAMNRYKEDIKFISDTGELTINGQVNMPFNKEYWMPDGDNGKPEIETIGGEGPELNDNDQLKYFKNQLYKISKIPLNRFDQESGTEWFGTDASSYARTEIDFARFVNRLRNIFVQIILKPIQLQMALDVPELQDNRPFLDALQMEWKSYNLFEEMMEIELMQKRVEFIQDMKDGLVDMDQDGNEIKFWSSKFLVQKYLHLSDADIKLNEKLKQEEIEELKLAGCDSDDEEGGMESLKDLSAEELQTIINEAQKQLDKCKDKKKCKKDKAVKTKGEDDEIKSDEEE